MNHEPRTVIIEAVQAKHDDVCYDHSCKCHERDWNTDLQVYVSAVAITEADELIAEIEEAAVRRYRGLEE